MVRKLWSCVVCVLVACVDAGAAPRGCAGGAGGHAEATAAFQGPLRLATWNLRWLGAQPGTGHLPRSDADFARLRAYADALDADIVALQEVDGPEAAARVFDPARYALHFSSRAAEQRTGFAYRRDLPAVALPDLRGLAVAEGMRHGTELLLALPGGRSLRLLSVHLASGCFDDPLSEVGPGAPAAGLGGSPACRRLGAQLPILAHWFDARAADAEAAVALGDFNRRFFASAGGDAAWRMLDDGEPAGTALHSPTSGRRAGCWGGRYPEFIDHMLFNGAAAAWLRPGSFHEQGYAEADARHAEQLSDHCPLRIELTVGPP